MNRTVALAGLLLALLLAFSGWSGNSLAAPAGHDADKVLATIDDRPLTEADFAAYLKLFAGDPRFRADTPAARKKMLQHLIDRTLLLEYARKKGYDRQETLKKHGSLSQQEKETIILRQLLNDEISAKVKVDEKAIASYHRQHPRLTAPQAREQWTSERQQELFRTLMGKLRRQHRIVIH
ncbi:MAG: hypothetical protein JRJ56_06895 [Deltaproteobacteria bacterium]|nr:hypothetical protein [Deltaproteobacteria bacterium]